MSEPRPGQGVLLLNIGTPDSTSVPDVRRYLAQFLADPRVIDIHPVARWLLLHAIILRFRPKRSAEAYKKIWTDRGSPLLYHCQDLTAALSERFAGQASVRLAMCYGNPSMSEAMDAFALEGIDQIAVLPLFPQYSSATMGSAIEGAQTVANSRWNMPLLQFIGEHPEDPGYIAGLAAILQPALDTAPDHVLFSFHGLPERHVQKSDPSGKHCLATDDCCAVQVAANRRCYRAQCFLTARALQAAVGLADEQLTIAFQSRFGRTPWIGPHTEDVLAELGRKGVQRLVVAMPSFVADCLETVEELGIRGREIFTDAGGGELILLPCLNATPTWIDGLEALLRRQVPGLRSEG